MKILPQLVRVYSREDALQKAETGRADKRLIETALRFYATEDGDIGVTYSGFCIISLPHKALKSPKDRWERRLLQNGCAMTIEPGFLELGGQTVELGVPYGSTARLIMIYLQTEALRHNSREIMLGRLEPGNFFGEITLFNPGPTTATVRGVSNGDLLILRRDQFDDFLSLRPHAALQMFSRILAEMANRLRQTDERLFDTLMWGGLAKDKE